MEQNKSAILQMLMGERGNFECIRFSEEYRKTRKKSLDKLLEFEKQLKEWTEEWEKDPEKGIQEHLYFSF